MQIVYLALAFGSASAFVAPAAQAVSSLVVTTRDMVPRIVTWNSRQYPNYADAYEKCVGIVRSSDDAAHTSIHACVLAPDSLQPQRGLQNHTLCVWPWATRNTTPKCASTSLVSLTSMPVAMNSSVKPPRDGETGSGGRSSTVVASARNLRKDSSTMDVIDRPDRAADALISRYSSSGSCSVVFTLPDYQKSGIKP